MLVDIATTDMKIPQGLAYKKHNDSWIRMATQRMATRAIPTGEWFILCTDRFRNVTGRLFVPP